MGDTNDVKMMIQHPENFSEAPSNDGVDTRSTSTSTSPMAAATKGIEIPIDAEAAQVNEEIDPSENSASGIAHRETRAVFWLKLSTLGVLLASAIGVAVTVFFYVDQSEEEAFESSFETDFSKVFEALSTTLFLTLGAVDSMIVSIVSTARFTNQSWPYVTIPDYAVRLAKVRSLSKAVVIQQSHFVTLQERPTWEQYTLDNDNWVTESLRVQKSDPTFQGQKFSNFTQDGVIHSYMGPSTGDGPFLPTWQSSPVIPVFSAYNWNALDYTSVSDAYDALLNDQRVVISKVSNLADPTNPISVGETDAAIEYIADFVGPDTDPTEPFSVISFPIIDLTSDKVAVFSKDDVETPQTEVLGVVTIMFFWKNMLQDVVPNTDGVICVFENKCDQTFSYRVDGPSVHYIGPFDAHDPEYHKYGQSAEIADLGLYSPTAQAYTGIPLTGEVCGYTLRVYPSDAYKEEFTSRNPALYSGVAIAIFVFCTAVFICYDIYVERRQRKVLNAVLRSKENVSSLEAMVDERTRKLQDSNVRLAEANERVMKASAAQLEHFASMSHEIRTPLNCIIGLSSFLLESELSAMQEESMRMIVNSGDLLLTVVNDILDYSKMESGNIEVVATKSSLQESLAAVIQSIEAKAHPRDLTVHSSFDPLLPDIVEMDCRRLQQLLYNLLGNAIRFSYPKSQIELSADLIEGRLDGWASDDEGDNYGDVKPSPNEAEKSTRSGVVRFSVKNYGQGIERRDFARIFEPFRQANAETERAHGGTGLGLAICSKIATKMNGSISVDSKEGEWAKFTVELPFIGEPVDAREVSRRLDAVTVFLVHKDPSSVSDLEKTFSDFKVELVTFPTMRHLAERVTADNDALCKTRVYVCLVHEDLYDHDHMESIAGSLQTTLLSVGPRYAVPQSKWHIRSLGHQLPCVLMDIIIKFSTSRATRKLSYQTSSTRSLRSSFRGSAVVSFANLSIMVAEDNRINQKVLHRILTKSLGIADVEIVENGQLAVEREAQKQFDVIFMDYQMPVMDGIEATKLITRRDDLGHSIPTIAFLTAHAAEEYEKQATDAGAAYFLTKPFRKEDIESFFKQLPALQISRLTEFDDTYFDEDMGVDTFG